MSRRILAVAVLACAISAQTVHAQGFGVGYTDIGPTIGIGGIGSASLAFGARAEHAIKTLPDLGDGILAIQAAGDYYSWGSSGSTVGGSWSSTGRYIPLGVTANYHFVLENRKIDPFLGLGLGYRIVSWSCNVSGFDCGGSASSALYFIGRAGARYFFQEKMSLYADLGAGAAALNVGLMFKLQ